MMDITMGFSAGVSSAPDRAKPANTVCALVNMMPTQDGRLSRRAGATQLSNHGTTLVGPLRTLEFSNDGVDYVLLFKYGQSPVVGSGSIPASAAGLRCVNKTTGEKLTITGTVPWAVALSGFTTAAQFGDYLLLASPGYPFTTQTTGRAPQGPVVWVKAGAFNTTYSVTTPFGTASVTTPKAEHEEILDTSGVPAFTAEGSGTTDEREPVYARADGAGTAQHVLTWAQWYHSSLVVYVNPALPWTNTFPAMPTTAGQYAFNPSAPGNVIFHNESVNGTQGLVIAYTHAKVVPHPGYARRVQELQEEYDGRVAAHAAMAANAVRPSVIVTALRTQLVTLGATATADGAYLRFPAGVTVSVSDGERGDLISAHGPTNPAAAIEDLPPKHYVGGFVPVGDADTAFGMLAAGRAGVTTTAGQFADVVWQECHVSNTETTWTGGVLFAKVHGGGLAVAETASALAALTGTPHPALQRQSTRINPRVLSSLNGHYPRTISVLHERLVIAARNFVALSTAGDPLLFDSLSALTVTAADSFALQATGMESEVLWGVTQFLGGLAFFGDGQYLLSGRTAVAATSTVLTRLSSTPVSKEALPCALGERLVSMRRTGGFVQFMQSAPGQVADSAVEAWLSALQVQAEVVTQLLWLPAGQQLVAVTPDSLWVLSMVRDAVGVSFAPWQIVYRSGDSNNVLISAVAPHNDGLLVFAGASVWWQPLITGQGSDPSGAPDVYATFPQPYTLSFAGGRRTGGLTHMDAVEVELEDSGHVDLALPSGYVERLSPDTLDATGSRTHYVPALEDAGRFTITAVGDAPLSVVSVVTRLHFTKRGN